MPNFTEIGLVGFVLYIAVLSVVTFWAYGIDKYRSIKGKWRISEKALMLLSFFGGAFGGFLAMKIFRHKTKHNYFWVVNYIGMALHIAIALVIAGRQ